ncbi:regulator of chromosome condensation 1/beta-lactamase-inhibitor protein II [Nemania sp. FL0031]|nr:regulator of chromosome condensation 1/beta-lactamase-inhibitor protein II [Nemania sp. FL0031]
MDGLFALGSNGSGQLGLGHKEDVSVPKQVEFSQTLHDDPITQVAAGGNHTIVITASGKAYWSGDYANGCCGIIESEIKENSRPIFRKLCLSSFTDMGPVIHATCTWDTTILVVGDENGQGTQLYSCGSAEPTGATPVPIPDFPPVGTTVTSLAAGFRHVVVVLNNGDVYGWGNGRKGQLGQMEDGTDAKGIVMRPRKIGSVSFKVVKVKRDGMLVAWGRDDHGQLPPPSLPEIASIAAGSEHVVALTATGDVLTWGWGEHGNCGPHTDKRFGDVKGRWNMLASLKNLPEGSSITAIGAGCATSWVNIMAEGVFL